jgi:hypothetical protein
MRYMLLLYSAADAGPAAGSPEQAAEMPAWFAFSQALVDAGAMLGGDPLHPIETATTVRVRDGEIVSTDGPFAETKELLAGFWLWQVKSFDEAVEWLKRAPFDGGTEIELRSVFEMEEFGEMATPERRERKEHLRAEADKRGR